MPAVSSSMNETVADTEVQAERLQLLLEQTGASARLAVAAATLSFALVAWYDFSIWLLCWYLAVTLISLWRARLPSRFRARYPDQCSLTCWDRLHYYSAIVAGLLWGLLGAQPTANLPPALQPFTLIGPALIATAAMSSYAIRLSHYQGFLLALFASLLASYGWAHGTESLAVWPPIVLFASYLYVFARRFHRTLIEALATKSDIQHAHRELEEANRHLLQQHRVLKQEEDIARHVFQQLTLAGDAQPPGIHVWNQAMGNLSGDLVQTICSPSGSTYVFLGDFTGHGLPAALGAVPTSTVFRTMTEKNLEPALIARELNRKLHTLLPTGYFCCAVVMQLSPDRTSLTLWNGGLPPVILRRANGDIEEIPSDNLPLGVVGNDAFADQCRTFELQSGDRVYAYSDGLTEAENHRGEMWGRDRLLQFLAREGGGRSALDPLREAVLEFTNLAPASDDISFVEIVAQPAAREAVA
ncbi:MAG: serine/threonine-protein phosphatase [Gammaproteobacteria bacterium]|nr:MAG: serine/threonine-protein phosphatase [Gammaproteobacteria bacterium]